MANKEVGLRIKIETNELAIAKRNVIDLENELKDLKKATKDNTDAQKAASKQFVELEVNLKAAKNKYSDLERETLKTNNALKEQSGFVDGIKKGFGGVGTAIAGAAIVVAGVVTAFETFKKVLTSTNEGAEQLEIKMSGAKGAIDGFFMSLRNGDWGNIVGNMQTLAKASEDFTASQIELKKLKLGAEYSTSQTNQQKADLDILRKTESAATKDRIAANEKFLQLDKEDADVILNTVNFEKNSLTKKLKDETKLTEIQADQYLLTLGNTKLEKNGKTIRENALKLLETQSDLESKILGVKIKIQSASGNRYSSQKILSILEEEKKSLEDQLDPINKQIESGKELYEVHANTEKVLRESSFNIDELGKAYINTTKEAAVFTERNKEGIVLGEALIKKQKDEFIQAEKDKAAAALKSESEIKALIYERTENLKKERNYDKLTAEEKLKLIDEEILATKDRLDATVSTSEEIKSKLGEEHIEYKNIKTSISDLELEMRLLILRKNELTSNANDEAFINMWKDGAQVWASKVEVERQSIAKFKENADYQKKVADSIFNYENSSNSQRQKYYDKRVSQIKTERDLALQAAEEKNTANQEIRDNLEKVYDLQLKKAKETYAGDLAAYMDAAADIEIARAENRDLLEKQDAISIENAKNNINTIFDIREQKEFDLKVKADEKVKQQNDYALNYALETASKITSIWEEVANRRAQAEINATALEYDKKIELLKKQGKDTTKLEEQKAKALDKIRREQFEKDKKYAIIQTVIAGARAIVQQLATTPLPAAWPFIIAEGAITAAQIALITTQKYAKGGLIQQGNIPTQPNGDNVLATVKTGEVVLNQDQQQALGGAETFKRIGVPGFALGGLVRARADQSYINTSRESNIGRSITEGMQTIRVIQDISGLESARGTYSIIQSQGEY